MKKALLVIDVQNGMFQEGNVVHKGDDLLQNLKGVNAKLKLTLFAH